MVNLGLLLSGLTAVISVSKMMFNRANKLTNKQTRL